MVGSGNKVILGPNPWIGYDEKYFLSEDLGFHLNSRGYFYLIDIMGDECERFGTQLWLSSQHLELIGEVEIEWNQYIS